MKRLGLLRRDPAAIAAEGLSLREAV
jgi:hypothetical protein